jgi:hypothetical protein
VEGYQILPDALQLEPTNPTAGSAGAACFCATLSAHVADAVQWHPVRFDAEASERRDRCRHECLAGLEDLAMQPGRVCVQGGEEPDRAASGDEHVDRHDRAGGSESMVRP